MRTSIIATVLFILAVLAQVPASAHAEETNGQTWVATRPEVRKIEIGDATPICHEYASKGQEAKLADCVRNAIVGIDEENANARKQLIADMDWVIDWITHHIDDLDAGTLRKLAPVADKLVELAQKGGLGMTDAERATLAALVSSRDYLSARLAEHDERIAKLEKEERGALTAHAGAYFFPYDVVVGGTACAEFTFAQGVVGLQGCAGAGATVNDGSGVILVEAALKFRVIEPLHLNLGYLYSRRPGSQRLEGADWVVSTATFGISIRVVKWLEMGGAAGVGECDFRDRVGKATCFDGKAYLDFRLPL